MSESLTDFLLARIAEDEAAARAASPSPWSYPGIESVAGGTLYDATRRIVDVVYEHQEDHNGSVVRHLLVPEADANGAHIARHDPARVLAECEAKRRIVERASVECVCTDHGSERVKDCPQCVACNAVTTADGYVLADLALPYASHPSYREEWRP